MSAVFLSMGLRIGGPAVTGFIDRCAKGTGLDIALSNANQHAKKYHDTSKKTIFL